MLRRSLPLAALAATSLAACYVSHAEFSDASSPSRDDSADAVRRDDGGPGVDDAGLGDDGDAGETDAGPCPGDDVIEASELVARAAEFDGRVVRVRGAVAESGPYSCTTGDCGAETPCCNDCNARVMLAGSDGSGPLLGGTGAAIPGCFGDECHFVCRPYDVGRRYVLRGTFDADGDRDGPALAVMGAPGDVCEESPPPDHRGAYRVTVKSSTIYSGECANWRAIIGGTGRVFASVGDPGQLEMWQALAPPPGAGRYSGTIDTVGSEAPFRSSIHWSCCDHELSGTFPDSRAIEATLLVHETGRPACDATFELVGMREDAPCADSFDPTACFAAGGIYAFVGPDTGEICSCPTYDGHETCTHDRTCEGACMAEIPAGGDCATVTSGRCTMGHRWSGCYCSFEAGLPAGETCWD